MDGSTRLIDAAVKSMQVDAAAARKAAGQATAAAKADAAIARGWLRRNIWGVAGAAVILALILLAVLAR